MICIFYLSSLSVAQMADLSAGSYIRIYGKSWLCSFSRESGDMFTSSLCGTMGVGFIG